MTVLVAPLLDVVDVEIIDAVFNMQDARFRRIVLHDGGARHNPEINVRDIITHSPFSTSSQYSQSVQLRRIAAVVLFCLCRR